MQLPVRKALMVFTCLLLPALTALAKNDGDQDGITLKKRNAPLEKIFHEIEKQSGYQFFYKVSMVSKFKNIDIDVKKATLEETLAVILKNQPFTYEIINKTIVLKQKEEQVATFGPPDPLAYISGRVVNDANEPLGGVSVRIKVPCPRMVMLLLRPTDTPGKSPSSFWR